MEGPVGDDGAIPLPVSDDETAAVSEGASSAAYRPAAAKRRGTLRVLTGAQAGRTYVVATDETVVGRGNGCDLQIDDAGLSRRHCRIVREGLVFLVEDLESRNGTSVDGEQVTALRPLHDGAVVQLGAGTTLKFSIKDDLELEAEQRLYESAVLDPLTGLHNRRHLDARLRAELAFAARHEAPLSVLVIDVDHFKKINDTLGHGAGDAALRALGERLQKSVRTEDVVARYGGEEFAVVARGIKAAGALLLAERIRETVARMRVAYEVHTIALTISVGVATMDQGRKFAAVDALLKAADDALYAAKKSGRNRCVQG
jgi:diguanylate cyclase (GGDEF)-like protein